MKKYLIIAAIALVVAALATISVQQYRITKLKGERDRYKANSETLLQDVDYYQTRDSLNVSKVGVLELKLSEFEKYRAADAEMIKTLQAKNRELQSVTNAQIETITELRANVRDSIVYLPGDTVTTVLKCVDISDTWFDLHGCTTPEGAFTGTFINRDKLLIAGYVEYKRFLGFLWKTKKIKSREIHVVSSNPHTKITGVEYIEIEK